MKYQKWSKLEAAQQVNPYDFGGILSGVGSAAMSVAPLAGPAGLIVGGIGAGLGLIGNLFSGNKAKKEQEKAQQAALMKQKEAQLLAMPMAQGGIQQGVINPMNMELGGYLPTAKSGIKIAPSKKGTFTSAATKHGKSVQAFASQVLANKENYSPAMVKKANFAKNASKWSHESGGYINPLILDNADFISFMGGGTHAQNPLGGIPMGRGRNGKQNTVESGESAFKFDEDKYVFSNKLRL